MVVDPSHRPRHRWLVAAALGVAGALLNLVPVQLSPGTDLVFGGVAFLVAAVALGSGPGLLAAVIASAPTLWLWNHPYAWLIFSAEGLAVGWFVQRWRRRPLVADAVYWALIGAPLIVLSYHLVLGVRGTTLTVILLKQPFNGLINALIVELLLLVPYVRRLLQLRGTPRLHSSLAVVVTLAAVVPTLAFGLWTGRQEWQRNLERTEAQLELLARSHAAQLAQYVALHEGVVRSVSQVAQTRGELDAAQMQRQLLAEHQHFPGFLNMYVADARAVTVAFAPASNASGRTLLGLDFSDRDYYRRLRETRSTVVSDVFWGRGGADEPLVAIVQPILLADSLAGYVLGALDLRDLPPPLRAAAGPERVRVLDGRGTVIFDSAPESGRPALVSLAGTEAFDAIRVVDSVAIADYQGEEATAAAAATAARMLAAVARMPGTGWWVWVEQPFAQVQAFVGRAYARLFALLIAVMLVTLLLSDLLARYLAAPLLRLRGAAAALGAGDQATRVGPLPASVPTEIHELGQSFDDMAASLLASTRELEELGEITRSLASTLDTDELLGLVTDAALRLVRAQGCGIALLDETGERLQPTAHFRGVLAGLGAAHASLDGPLLREVVRGSAPLLLRPLGEAERHSLGIEPQASVRSLIAVPLVGRSGALGVLLAVRAGTRAPDFSPADLRLIERLARTAAVAVENARLLHAAEAASRAKTDFIATMSHELRTPLNAVLGHVELLQMGIHGALNETQRAALDRVTVASRHLRGLIEEVLSFSRLEAGRAEVHLRPTDLGALVREVGAVIEPLAVEKGLRLHVHACPTTDAADPVLTDPDKVRQILINLAGNAVKFTERGEVELRLTSQDGVALLAVRDTGPGIPPSMRPRLFRPFEQLESGLARAHGGTGLGLYLSRRYAELVGGRIDVRSEPGEGSTFTLVLPREG